MMTLVTGGSASGKSEYAENLAYTMHQENKNAPFFYIATMQAFDREAEEKIKRHREMRKHKGFTTIECFLGLKELELPKGSIVLLDCMSNLVANEMFDPKGAREHTVANVLEGIQRLLTSCHHVVVVTNEVFGEAGNYSEETMQYVKFLGEINRQMAVLSQKVVEVVYGIPVIHKQEERT